MPSDRLLAWFTSTLPDAGVRASGKTQAHLYRLTGGRLGGRFGRGQVLVLTTVGRRSRQPRRTTVLYVRDDDHIVVIGSNTGSKQPPAWALNLLATPEAHVQVGRQQMRVRATEVMGSERTRLWELMSEQYAGFDIYTKRTAREFKVFALEPL
jgi:deazaflavin-dependent oxidoreductase (nitroreductase family)